MGRTTTSSEAVSNGTKLSLATAIQQTIASRDSVDGYMISADEEAANRKESSEPQPDLYWQSIEDDTAHREKKYQFDMKAKDTFVVKSGHPKRGRPKISNGRRGG